MGPIEIILLIILGLLLVLVSVVLIRTLMFKPIKEEKIVKEELNFDRKKCVKTLQEMIKCRTISYADKSKEEEKEFIKFEKVLKDNFPNVYKVCKFNKISDRSLLFRWVGKDSSKATVLMSHYDVVEVNEEGWSKPPFAGIIENNVLWGRGTLDTKGTLNGVLNAAENLILDGFTPENDIYFAFGGNEEVNGDGAVQIVEYFKQNKIKVELVIDEGGAVVEKVFPGVRERCAVIGIGEKGVLNLKMEVKTNGGHSSTPSPKGAVYKLSKACVDIEKNPFKANLSIPTKEMFNTLGRHSTFVYRMIFANLWLFKGVLDMICKKSGGELNALMRTTCAFTQMEGSKQINVLPPVASVSMNLRLMSGETMNSAQKYITKVIDNEDIVLTKYWGINPTDISEINCNEWNVVKKAIRSTWEHTIVTPYLMLAGSDARHYNGFCNHVYRFSAMHLSKEERATIHGHNERIPVDTIEKTVEFYIRVMKNL